MAMLRKLCVSLETTF